MGPITTQNSMWRASGGVVGSRELSADQWQKWWWFSPGRENNISEKEGDKPVRDQGEVGTGRNWCGEKISSYNLHPLSLLIFFNCWLINWTSSKTVEEALHFRLHSNSNFNFVSKPQSTFLGKVSYFYLFSVHSQSRSTFQNHSCPAAHETLKRREWACSPPKRDRLELIEKLRAGSPG